MATWEHGGGWEIEISIFHQEESEVRNVSKKLPALISQSAEARDRVNHSTYSTCRLEIILA